MTQPSGPVHIWPGHGSESMNGLIDLCRTGFFKKDETVVFVHTGGSAALFAYQETFETR